MPEPPYPEHFANPQIIPKPFLAAIGQVCVHFANLESIVDLAIGKLASFQDGDARGAIVTAHMSWPQKIDVMQALVDLLLPEFPHLSKFETVVPLLKVAQKGRNRIIHGQWGCEDGKVQKLRLTARGKLAFSIDEITLKEILAISNDIGEAGLALLKAVLNK
jgi:hypothetical protein